MATPTERVLGIPELLEDILLHVDMKTLLLSQRVNSRFRDVVLTSPGLLEILHFRQRQAMSSANREDIIAFINPLLFKTNAESTEPNDMEYLPDCTDVVTGKTLSCHTFPVGSSSGFLRVYFTVDDGSATKATSPGQRGTESIDGSWQRMYLFSSLTAEVRRAEVKTWLHDHGPNKRWQLAEPRNWRSSTTEMTFGELLEHAKSVLLHNPVEGWDSVRVLGFTCLF
ncbi:hypothetical protein LTR17_027116 [Elasticomyces elasticus]|nr:hypothetical protein LTR17_027116 [Elasticomyces elasticus]